jgi:hypothetical protein
MLDDIFTINIIKFNTLYICYKISLLGRREKERRGRKIRKSMHELLRIKRDKE